MQNHVDMAKTSPLDNLRTNPTTRPAPWIESCLHNKEGTDPPQLEGRRHDSQPNALATDACEFTGRLDPTIHTDKAATKEAPAGSELRQTWIVCLIIPTFYAPMYTPTVLTRSSNLANTLHDSQHTATTKQ